MKTNLNTGTQHQLLWHFQFEFHFNLSGDLPGGKLKSKQLYDRIQLVTNK